MNAKVPIVATTSNTPASEWNVAKSREPLSDNHMEIPTQKNIVRSNGMFKDEGIFMDSGLVETLPLECFLLMEGVTDEYAGTHLKNKNEDAGLIEKKS